MKQKIVNTLSRFHLITNRFYGFYFDYNIYGGIDDGKVWENREKIGFHFYKSDECKFLAYKDKYDGRCKLIIQCLYFVLCIGFDYSNE